MSAGLRPYPAYRDSGVEWIGQVPVHWDIQRLRNVVEMRVSNVDKHAVESETPVRLCNYVDVYNNDHITEGMQFMKATASADELRRFRLNCGDVVITKDSESWDDIGVPALVQYAAPDLVCGYHLAVLRPRQALMDSGYLLRAFQSPGVSRQLFVAANGVTRYGLSHSAIKSVWLTLPPSAEQAAIARYLGYMDRRIRRYIRAKQKLIKLLEEQKQVIIHQAVTGQIDVRTAKPYPAYKDSGVKWLGNVPECWDVRRIKRTFAGVVGGATPPSADPQYWDGEVVWVTPSDVAKSGRLSDSERHITASGLLSCSAELVPAGSVVVTSRAPVGNVAIAETDLCTNQGCKALVPNPKLIEPLYALQLVLALKNELQSLANGTTFSEISTARLGSVRIPLPPLDEQSAVVAHIERATTIADSAIDWTEQLLHRMREYRARLISDVVTGKLDVREAAANLPDDAEEPEELAEDELLADESELIPVEDDEVALEDLEEVET